MQAAVTMIFDAPPIFLAISSQLSSFMRLALRIFSVTSALFIVFSRLSSKAPPSAGELTAAKPGFSRLEPFAGKQHADAYPSPIRETERDHSGLGAGD